MRNEHERLNGSDEIDLVELVQGVWRQKYWAMAIALPIIILGVAYAQLASPVYEAKLYVQPPSQNDIAQLNYGRGGDSGLTMLTIKDVYEVYLRSLQSEAVRNQFFRTVYLPTLSEAERSGSRDALYGHFNSLLKVGVAAKDSPMRFILTANLEDPEKAALWVETYAQMAASQAKHEVLMGSQSDTLNIADNLQQLMDGAQVAARKTREDEVVKLKEALRVARSIGLEQPPIISGEISAGMDGPLTYMRGSKALEAEIANLESRVSDDPFIEGLRSTQERLTFYRGLKIEPSTVAVYHQDGEVEQPDKPIKPRKVLIVLLSALLGIGLGLAVALCRDVWSRRRAI